ncbi:Flagellar basal body rod protein FlgB [bioreactor metagenome]|uniref:Flagellar basal body rod protein FlgB n=1 Tax=bioreactor metagenome TaxID=1076179 RepID=A0A644T928_9ZZZZ|nr:flagellar basal body rod protein FlgB [Negativicutes bacterium]
MLRALLANPQLSVLEQGINASSLRHKVVSNNIANVNTPGFKKSEVVFEDLLQEELKTTGLPLARTKGNHLSGQVSQGSKPFINTINSTSFRADDNNVDIDVEMANLAKNNIYYNALVNQLSKHFTNIKSAINEGRR